MLASLTIIFIILPFSSVSAIALVPSEEPETLIAAPLPSSNSSITQIITSHETSNSSLAETVLKIQCDATLYGRNPNVQSCTDVFHYMSQDDRPATFAQRNSGIENDVPLPWRTMSNDGRCLVQPVLKKGATSGRASATEVGGAAYTLLHRCVIDKGVGGIAGDIGGDGNLNVAIAKYSPNVRCDRGSTPGPPWESCVHIWADMPTSQERQVFGHSGDPRVQVTLPILYKATDARCMVKIDMAGKATSVSWYEIWEAILALSSMCVRAHKKGGKATRLGLRQNIFLELSDEYPDLDQPREDIVQSPSLPAAWIESSPQSMWTTSLTDMLPSVASSSRSNLEQSNSSWVTLPDDTASNTSPIAIL